nr:MAG: hypothetical protein OI716_00185 [Candidatus Methanoperedens sp.]
MNKNELEEIRDYYGEKLNCLHTRETFKEIPYFEEKLLKTDYSYEEWKETIECLESIKKKVTSKPDFNYYQHEKLNKEPLHFFYELLQNADDCDATDICIEITPEKISFRHNGNKQFSLKDVFNICSSGESDKEETKIGKFGVGFKTVFSFCSEPIIKCPNGCNFKLIKIVIPVYLEGKKDGTNTEFILPIDNKKIDNDFLNRIKQLDIDWKILLFLNKISSIKVENKISGENYSIQKEGHHNDIYSLKKNDEIISSWLKKDYNLDKLKTKYSLSIVPRIIIAIYLEDNILIPLQNSENKFYLYMPFESEINPFNFLIHADFKCTLNRGSLPPNYYNIDIFQCLKEKIFELVESLSHESEYSHCFLNVLPLKNDKENFEGQFYGDFPDEISNFVKDKIVFTDNFGEKINTPLVANADIIDLINDDNELIKNISKNLVNFKLHELSSKYITSWNIMPIFSIHDFMDEIKTIDLLYKKDSWFIKLFLQFENHLINIEKEKEKVKSEEYEKLNDQYNNIIKKIQNLNIYREENGHLGHLFYDETNVVKYFFLPTDEEKKLDVDGYALFKEKLTFLNKELYRNEKEKILTHFFEKIGVNNFNLGALIDSYILMEYDNFINKKGDVKEEDLFSYTTYIFKNYIKYTNKEKFNNSSKKIHLKTKADEWIVPTKIYFSSQYFPEINPSHYIEEIFSVIKNIYFLDPKYLTNLKFNDKINSDDIIKFFRHIGVDDKPRMEIVEIKEDFSRYKINHKAIIDEEMKQIDKWETIPYFMINKCLDYTSKDLISFLETDLEDTKKQDLYKKLIKLIDSKWKIYLDKNQIKLIGKYGTNRSYNKFEKTIHIKTNSVIESLKEPNRKWIPSTDGFKCAGKVFYNRERLRLIPNQPYLFDVVLKDDQFVHTFFLQENIEDVIIAINTIKKLKIDFNLKKVNLVHILNFLSKKEIKDEIKDKIKKEEVILVYQGDEKWYSIDNVFWNYREPRIFGERGCISTIYKDNLYEFFRSLGMRDKCDIKDYFVRLNELEDFSKEGLNDIKFKEIRDIIYGNIEHLLDKEEKIDYQIEDFKKNGVLYFNDNHFNELNAMPKIFYNDYKELYDKFIENNENFRKYFIDGDYNKFPKFFKKLGYSFRSSVVKKLSEESIEHFSIENDFFDLNNIEKYLIDVFKYVHKREKLTDMRRRKIFDLASIEIMYAESIPIKYYVKQLENFAIIKEENYFYNIGNKTIFIKKSKEKLKKIIGIAKGLCDFFVISQDYAPFFEYIIENSNNIEKIKEYLEAHEIDFEKKSKPPEDKPPEDKPPEDKPPEDKPPEDKPPEDKPPEDKPPEDKPPEDKPPEDKPPEDKPPEGKPPEGKPPEGKPPEGKPPEGKPPEGKPPEGKPPEGKPPEGKPPEDKPPEGKITSREKRWQEQNKRNSEPSEWVKSSYNHHCQVCLSKENPKTLTNDTSYAGYEENKKSIIEAHHIKQVVRDEGDDVVGNLLSLCKHHHDLLDSLRLDDFVSIINDVEDIEIRWPNEEISNWKILTLTLDSRFPENNKVLQIVIHQEHLKQLNKYIGECNLFC